MKKGQVWGHGEGEDPEKRKARQERFMKRREKAGIVSVKVMVPEKDSDQIRKLAAKLRSAALK